MKKNLDVARLRAIVNMQNEELERNLKESEQMWKDKENQAKIIGYLQGALKGALIINEILIKKLEK